LIYEKFKGENTHPKFLNNLKSGGELLSKRIPLVKLGFLVSNKGGFHPHSSTDFVGE
jgi:hypothetical protein